MMTDSEASEDWDKREMQHEKDGSPPKKKADWMRLELQRFDNLETLIKGLGTQMSKRLEK